ncbi:LytR/AlgR family response regulator transcription factor [Croceimicrobium hydrocarbonivorans]|uniref:Response regulator transcription factor n=1 Tax=Croceimicrobium hydrocarbonivorans TaxID=2761580 RepID=A0A7H0VCF6_9FLAO|nr:response regulator transcription factor [Croceimicrobium hydrocarbonivorans]QNR23404.1 response regulator transcription factor [Croceimicrobium hydrocarbonivorans]
MNKVLIVEDEALIAEHLHLILSKDLGIDADIAYKAKAARKMLQEKTYDLILVDINLESERSGLELAAEIEEYAWGDYLFLTAQTDKGVLEEARKLHPKAYLVKPFKDIEVSMAVGLALKNEDEGLGDLVFKDGWTTVKLPIASIRYAEADGNYIKLFSTERSYLIRYSLSWFYDQVADKDFLKIHRARVVNTRIIKRYNRSTVDIGGEELPVSKSGYQALATLFEK